jgi:hypothetical protein
LQNKGVTRVNMSGVAKMSLKTDQPMDSSQ